LPEAQLAEVVERRMEVGLATLGKGGGTMDVLARMAFVEYVGKGQMLHRHQLATETGQRGEGLPRHATGVKHDDIGLRAGALDRTGERRCSHRVVGIGDERDEGVLHDVLCLPVATPTTISAHQETDFNRLPSGSCSTLVAISLVQAERAGTRERSTR